MSKGPTPRHSKSPEPVTIDLDATDVTPRDEPLQGAAADDAEPVAGEAQDANADLSDTDAPAGESPGAPEPAASSQAGGNGGRDADAAAADPAVKAGFGATAVVLSGLLGGVLALGGGYLMQSSGLLPAPGSGDQALALSNRVDALATTVEGLASQPATPADPDMGDAVSRLAERLDGVEATLAEAGARPATASDPAALSALEARIEMLAGDVAALTAGGAGDGANPALAASVAELSAGLNGLSVSVSDLKAKSAEIETAVSAVTAAQATASETLESRLASIEARLDAPAAQLDVARAIAAGGLKSAIDRGMPFMAELEAFATVAPDDPAIAELRDLAARGVPSRSELIAEFPAAANAAIAAAAPADPDAGLVNRLMTSALSVVKVRQVGEVEGDSAEAIAARAEARLLDGDLETAVREWNSLPEASRAAAAAFGEGLAARLRAEKLIAASLVPAPAAAAN